MRIDLWQGDLAPPAQFTLGGTESLEGATVSFAMAQVNGAFALENEAVVDDPVQRTGHYDWQEGDTDVPGVFRAVARATYSDQSGPQTSPSDEPIYVVIREKLASPT